MPKWDLPQVAPGTKVSFGPMMSPQVNRFLLTQTLLMDEVKKFSSNWYKRRQNVGQAAMRAATVARVADPAEMVKAMAEFQAHQVQCLTEDTRECMEMMARCAGHIVLDEPETVEDITAEAGKSENHYSAKAIPV